MIEILPPFEYLKKHKPFSFLSERELEEVIGSLESEVFRKGEMIFKKSGKPLKYVYLLKSGRVKLKNGHEEILTDGDVFGVASAISGNPPRFTAIALEDSVCYLIRRNSFLKVFNSNQKFSDFFTSLLSRRLSSLLKLSKKSSHGLENLYSIKVSEIVSRKAVTCSPETSVVEAAKIMDRNRVGSVVVVADGKPVGVFTQRDLMKLVAKGKDLEDSVGEYMTSPVISINENDSLIEAYLAIVTNAINHIVVMGDGGIKGVVSTKDLLLKLSSASSLLSISRKVARAGIDELKEIMEEIKSSIENMVISGADFDEMSKIACGIYELVVKRCAQLSFEGCVFFAGDAARQSLVFPPMHLGIIAEDWHEFVSSLRRIGAQPLDTSSTLNSWMETIDEWFSSPREFAQDILMFMDTKYIFGPKELYLAWKGKFDKMLEEKREDVIKVFVEESKRCTDIAKAFLFAIKALELKGEENEVSEAREAYSVVMDVSLREILGSSLGKVDELLMKEANKILARIQESL